MKILVAGDYYPVRRAEVLLNEGDYTNMMGSIKELVKSADYSIVNYESTFFGDREEITKYGPNMGTDEKSIELAEWCGFNCFTLGNNHVHDYGDKGLADMISCIKKHNIDYVGAGMDITDSGKTLYKEVSGQLIAIINCCEHEFNVANEEHGGANPLNAVRQYYAIKEARKKSDIVIVIVHGGSINCQLPSPRMQELYRFFVDCGASAVVNHHQHCYSGYEYYKGTPIVYGLGNLYFDKPWLKNTSWTEGYMVMLDFDSGTKCKISLYPYTQCADKPSIVMMDNLKLDNFFKSIKIINEVIKEPKILKERYNQWCDTNNLHCVEALNYFNKIGNKYARAFAQRYLPSLTVDTLPLLNYIYCESHLDRMLRYLKQKYNVQ